MSLATLTYGDDSLQRIMDSTFSFKSALNQYFENHLVPLFESSLSISLYDSAASGCDRLDQSISSTNSKKSLDSLVDASIDEIAEEAVEELEEYKKFLYGWDGYEGSAIDNNLADIAQLLVIYIADKFKRERIVPIEITPGPISDGSINIELSYDDVYAIITLPSELDAIHFYSEFNGVIEEETEIKPNLEILGEKVASLFVH